MTTTERNLKAVDRGFCGHVCDGGEFDTFVCTLEPEHQNASWPVVHQSVQVGGEFKGQISGAWLDDGTAVPDDVNLGDIDFDIYTIYTPSLDQQARIEQRVEAVTEVVDRMVSDYRELPDNEATVMGFCVGLVNGYNETGQNTLEQACEALAVSVRKLAGRKDP